MEARLREIRNHDGDKAWIDSCGMGCVDAILAAGAWRVGVQFRNENLIERAQLGLQGLQLGRGQVNFAVRRARLGAERGDDLGISFGAKVAASPHVTLDLVAADKGVGRLHDRERNVNASDPLRHRSLPPTSAARRIGTRIGIRDVCFSRRRHDDQLREPHKASLVLYGLNAVYAAVLLIVGWYLSGSGSRRMSVGHSEPVPPAAPRGRRTNDPADHLNKNHQASAPVKDPSLK